MYLDDACDATTAPVVEICRHLSDIAQVPSGKLPDVVVVNGYADAATEWDLTAAKRVLIGHVRYGTRGLGGRALMNLMEAGPPNLLTSPGANVNDRGTYETYTAGRLRASR